jgi:hypothetical protein
MADAKFVDNPSNVVKDMLEGLVAVHHGLNVLDGGDEVRTLDQMNANGHACVCQLCRVWSHHSLITSCTALLCLRRPPYARHYHQSWDTLTASHTSCTVLGASPP